VMLAGSDAAPAGRRRTLLLHPGGAGAPPGDTTVPREELADGGPLRLARGPDQPRPPKRGLVSAPKAGQNAAPKARPGAGVKTPRWSAERRASFRQRTPAPQGVDTKGCAARRSVPSTCSREKNAPPKRGRDDGLPGAAKNTGDDARLLVIPGRGLQPANPESRSNRCARFWIPGSGLRPAPE
jgi:hypothetical protein